MKASIEKKSKQEKKPVSAKLSQSDFLSGEPPPVNSMFTLQKSLGNRAVQRLVASKVIQTKLKIGQPDDFYEREADRVAEQVMRMPAPEIQMKKP